MSDTIVNSVTRTVRVNRAQTPEQMIEFSEVGEAWMKDRSFMHYVDDDVLPSMPKGFGEEVTVSFFRLFDQELNPEALLGQYALRGIVPADPYSVLAVNGSDRSFALQFPNRAIWRDPTGTWCYCSLQVVDGRTRLYIKKCEDRYCYNSYFFHAGLPVTQK